MVRKLLIIAALMGMVGCAGQKPLMIGAEDTADSRPVSNLDELTSAPATDDIVYIIDGGISKKITVLNLMKILQSSLTSFEIQTNNLPSDGKKVVGLLVFDDSTDVATGSGVGDVFFRIPSTLDGWNLVGVAAANQTAAQGSGSEVTNIQIYNVTTGNNMLTTNYELEIDEDDTDSSAAAVPAQINTSYDNVATGQQLRVDVSAVPSVLAAKGLYVELTFKLP